LKEDNHTIIVYIALGNEYTITKSKFIHEENIPFSNNNQSIRYNYKIADSDKCRILEYYPIYVTICKS